MEYKNDPLLEEINKVTVIDQVTSLAFIVGIIVGIIIASFLHKYIVHPLGY